MLVLTRKIQQQIQIGPNITITILQVKGQAVRVGIEAPRDVCVLRTELAERIASEESVPAGNRVSVEPRPSARTLDSRFSPLPTTPAKSGLLRCRAPRSVRIPLRQHLKRQGPASRSVSGCLAPSSVNDKIPASVSTLGLLVT